jgi:hypothetical protein
MQQTIEKEVTRLRQQIGDHESQIEAIQARAAERVAEIKLRNIPAKQKLAEAETRKAKIEEELRALWHDANLAGIAETAAIEGEARATINALRAQQASIDDEIRALTQPAVEE